MLRCSLAFVALVFAPLASHAQTEAGVPLMQIFRPSDFGDATQCFGGVQDRAGLLYVGVRENVLVYDGVEWTPIPVPGLFTLSLAVDAEDRIWIGGFAEIGYLENDGRGGRRYVSFADQLPETMRAGFRAYHIYPQPDGVFFLGREHLVRWHDGRVEAETIKCWLMPAGDRLYRHVVGKPLEIWQDGAWRVFLEHPILEQAWVHLIAPQSDGSQLLATNKGGFFRLGADRSLAPFPTEADHLMKGPTGFDRGLVLRDGTMVLNFRPNAGVAFVSPQGRLLHHLSTEHGVLPASTGWSFFQDRRGDVWLFLELGMARIDWPVTTTVIPRGPGVAAGLGRFTRAGSRLYVTMVEGLFAITPSPRGPAQLLPVPGARHLSSGAAGVGDDLIFSTQRAGLFRYAPGMSEPQPIFADHRPLSQPYPSPHDPSVLLLRAGNTLLVVRRGPDGWHKEREIPEINADIRGLAADDDGSLWAMTSTQGVLRLRGVPGTKSAGEATAIETYPVGHDLGPAKITPQLNAFTRHGRTGFLEDDWLFHFDGARRAFVAEYRLSERMPVPFTRRASYLVGALGDSYWAFFEHDGTAPTGPAKGRSMWLFDYERAPRMLPRRVLDAAGIGALAFNEPAADGAMVCWMQGASNTVRVELPAGFASPIAFHATLRWVRDAAGELLPLAPTDRIELPYAERTLVVTAASDRLDTRQLRFQWRLDDNAWSAWAPERVFHFERMPAGRHTIAVRARDSDGNISEPATYAFKVLPPWWGTWWALGLYGLGAAGGLAGVVRWRVSALRRRNTQLEQIVAERTEELRNAKAAAESANHAKSAFLANMSHELRTPLNAILGYAQILRREDGLSDRGRRQLGIVGRNGEHLLQMINEVLDLAKIEAGKMTLHVTEFPLARVVKTAADLFEQRTQDKGLAFRFELGAGLPKIVASDEQKLRQVLLNLLGNAVKFTTHGEVTLRVSSAGILPASSDLPAGCRRYLIRFEVRDTGPGIPPDQLRAIFEPFHQASTSAATQGTGLGLPISQRIVELLGGTIHVESIVAEAGRGVPAEPSLGERDRRDGSPGTVRPTGSRFWFDLSLTEVAAPATTPAVLRTITGYRGPRCRLLIADDEPTNRAVLRDLLEPIGFEIVEVGDGAACLAAIVGQRYDALLLDLRMPVLGGLEAVTRLRTLPHGKTLPIIAVSASVLGFDQNEAIKAGCDDFLAKPVQEQELFAALGRALPLEWTYRETAAPFESTAAFAADGELPDAATLDALLALARGGDVDALREQIAALLARGGAGAHFLREIDALAAGFKTADIRHKLADAHTRVAAH